MRIQYASDLHTEWGAFVPIENAGADVLVLAGDIGSFNSSQTVPVEHSFLRQMERYAAAFPDVVYVLGNHEYYHGNIGETLDTIKNTFSHLSNVHILDGDGVVIQGVPFFGATLWTDFDHGNPLSMHQVERGLNDFRLILRPDFHRITAEYVLSLHEEAKSRLLAWLATQEDDCVVVTHHAPSFLSIHQKYIGSTINGGFASDLSSIMLDHPQIKLWFHGHMHDSFDYSIGQTRVLANPRGYPQGAGSENRFFRPDAIVKLGS